MGQVLLEFCGVVASFAVIVLLVWWDAEEDLGRVTPGWRKHYWRRKGTDDE